MDFKESFSGDLVITDLSDSSETATVTVRISKSNFCDYSNEGDLSVKIDDVKNKGVGEDDTWYPFDEIEVEVEVENEGNEDIEDVSVEWGLYDKDNDQWIIEVDEEDEFDIDEDDTEVVTFSFVLDDDLDVDLDDLEAGDYVIYVRATGEIKDEDTMTCASDSEEAEMVIEDDYVILNDLKITGTTFCGSIVQLTADVWNIGEDDQEDITINIYNKDLGINEDVLVGDIDSFEDKTLNFEFEIPKGIEEQKYGLTLSVYDDDGDIYENSEDEESEFTILVDVSGNCELIPEARVLASLESGGKAGGEMKIRATLTNEGSELETFTIQASDYASWAELVEIVPDAVTLGPGQARDIILTFNVNEDAGDTETFSILVEDTRGGVKTQLIEASIEKGLFSGMFQGSGLIWTVAILNVILILIIIIIAIRVARR
jgi:uncharacterized membrane protein